MEFKLQLIPKVSKTPRIYNSVTACHLINYIVKFSELIREQNRIVGGEASVSPIPFQVSIRFKGKHWCDGSIIGPSEILSAAHCFQHPYSTQFYSIRAGSLKLNGNDSSLQERLVASIIIHSEYIPDLSLKLPNDIAIVKLTSPLDFNPFSTRRKPPCRYCICIWLGRNPIWRT